MPEYDIDEFLFTIYCDGINKFLVDKNHNYYRYMGFIIKNDKIYEYYEICSKALIRTSI